MVECVQVAYMTRSEMSSFDWCFVGPLLLIANQYLGVVIEEHFMLWLCFVSSLLLTQIRRHIDNVDLYSASS